MLFSSALLPIIGLLISVGDLSRSIKLILLAVLAGAFVYDLQKSKRRAHAIRNRTYLSAIILIQALLSFSWIDIYFNKPIGLDISRFMLVILAGFPWLVIWQALTTEFQSTRLLGIPPSGIGVITWACITTILSKLGIGSDSTMLTYGGTVEGSVLSQFRTILPGFAGIVPGGVFCGLSLAFSIAGFLLAKRVAHRAFFLAASVLAAYGIFLTDVRSAAGATIITGSLGLVYYLSIERIAKSGIRRVPQVTRRAILLSGLLPFLVPIVIPTLDSLTENISNSFVSARLLRSSSEGIFSFAGRSQIWNLSIDLASSRGLSFISLNSIGENGAGVSETLFETGLMPGTAESAHSHNSALNFYYSFGLIGLIALAYLIFKTFRALRDQPADRSQLAYLLPFLSIMVFMSLESLLSVTYTYFGLFFTLFNIDIFREVNSEKR